VAEGLTNIVHHAQAHNVAVDLRMKDHSLMVTIQDDGVGFDPSVIPSGHYGILGMKERVRLVNGNLEIQSEKDKGTAIKIEIPLSEDKA
jgi:NarL family two-component system sensor histidine kinase YdfH